MKWRTREGEEAEIKDLKTSHLLGILKFLRNVHIKAWRTEGVNPRSFEQAFDRGLRPYAEKVMWQEIREELAAREVTIPESLLPEKIPAYVRDGTPDLQIGRPGEPKKQFDPQAPKLKKAVEAYREARTVPGPRGRSLIID